MVALGASVLMHGGILWLCAKVAAPVVPHEQVAIPRPPIASRLLIETPPDRPQPAPQLGPPRQATPTKPPPPMDMPPSPAPKPKPIIPPALAPQDPPVVLPDGFGELTGGENATAMHSLSGDKPMEAPKGDQDQPYISRDPSGTHRTPEKPANADEGNAEVPGKLADAGVSQKAVRAQPAPTPPPTIAEARPPIAAGGHDSNLPGPHASLATRPSQPPLLALAQPATRPQSEQEIEARRKILANAGSPDAASSPTAAADPAPATDSEMDPFSVTGAAIFRPGRVSAMFGRKVTTVRPRLSLAAQYDLLSLPSPNVVLRVRADETGKVMDVAIQKSSGSRDVDQPCKLAMYDWWFEPPRDSKGRPKACEMQWTISFRVR